MPEERRIPDYDRLKELRHFEEKNFQEHLTEKIYDEEMGQELMGTLGWWSNWWQPYDELIKREEEPDNWYY